MKYTPCFEDPRIRRRAEHICEFIERYLQHRSTFWLSRKQIYAVFGNTARQPARWFKSQLLLEADPWYSSITGKCKTYALNKEKYQQLCRELGYTTNTETQWVDELSAQPIDYELKSNRLFHPLQFQPKYRKRRILGKLGYRYEFDIRTAAHTLLLQHAQHLGYQQPMPTLEDYVARKQEHRARLAELLGVEERTVKTMLTAILQGAVISSWHTSKIFVELDYNRHKLELLREDAWIKEYQREIRGMWKHIKSQRGITERITGRIKSGIYRELELEVGKCIQRYLKKTKNTYFFEHDGWSCVNMIDPVELTATVRQQTGFVIELDCTVYEEV